MRTNKTDINNSRRVSDFYNQPVSVSANIKHHPIALQSSLFGKRSVALMHQPLIGMFGGRIGAGFHVSFVGGESLGDFPADLGVLFYERGNFFVVADEVGEDQHLPVAPGPGADSDRRNSQLARDAFADFRRDAFEHHRKDPRRFERFGVGQQLRGLCGGAALPPGLSGFGKKK